MNVMLAASYDEAVSRSTKLVTVTGLLVWGATQNIATCRRELHCSPVKHPSKLFLSVLASVCVLVVCDHSDGSTCCQTSAPTSVFLSDTVVGNAYVMISLCQRDSSFTGRWKIHVFWDVTLCRGYVSGVSNDCTVFIFVAAMSKKTYSDTSTNEDNSFRNHIP